MPATIPRQLPCLDWAGALAVGTSHAVLDYVIPYVKEREAFGEPIARRQAVAFMCANIAIELDGLRLLTWRGAARADQGLPFAREAALAKRLGTEKSMQIGLDGVQLLGGHGYTKGTPGRAMVSRPASSASPRASSFSDPATDLRKSFDGNQSGTPPQARGRYRHGPQGSRGDPASDLTQVRPQRACFPGGIGNGLDFVRGHHGCQDRLFRGYRSVPRQR